MAKELWRAAWACVMVVCSAGTGVLNAGGDSARQHVGRGSVAAGRVHTVMATPDGRVSVWGGGGRGQIGDGALFDRWVPAQLPNLDGIVQVSAGAAHTVAVTMTGDVYAWGANAFGRLGDGTLKRRARPVRVRGIERVTMVAAGSVHTLALTADGRVFAWGGNSEGQLGIGNKRASFVPVHVRDLPAVAMIAAGDAHSLAVTRGGRIYAWGSNQFSRLGDGTTKNRLRPVALGLSDVVSVAGGAAHSLALLRDGSVYSWGRGAKGELGTGSERRASTPAVIPGLKAAALAAGGRFSAAIRDDGSVVAWGANESGQLGDGTTTSRSRPVVVGGVLAATTIALGDAHAIAVTVSGDVRTWGAGGAGRLGHGTVLDRATASEIISDIPDWGVAPGEDDEPPDTVPPSIAASVSPLPTGGWWTTPVTVSFQCADDVGIGSCPGPVTVASDGYAQRITGTAVDLAGNAASASVDLNLDLNPPVLSIAEPHDHATTTASEIVVAGHAVDAGSGLAEARCNGQPAAIVGDATRCVVPLKPGQNQIVLHARDVAGFNASAAVTVTRAVAAASLVLTPATRTLEVSDVATLSLRDEFGVRVEQASWTSDSGIVTLSGDDPPQISARALGIATITAEKDGRSAAATIRVSAGLAPGDERWSVPVRFDYSVDLPLFANRVAPDVPSVFTVEAKSQADAVLRALSAEGELLWQQHVDGMPLMGDSFGGIIAGIVDGQGYRGYARLGGGTIQPWRYDSGGRLGRPAQSSDGTIYAIERLFAEVNQDGYEIWDKHAIVLDGATGGLISRTLLTRDINHFFSARDGEPIDLVPPGRCRTTLYSNAPETLDPIAGSDGRGYLVVRRSRQVKHGDCFEQIYELPDRTIDMGLDLVILSRTAPPERIGFYATSCTAGFGTRLLCDSPVHAIQIMPDGIGGTLVVWRRGGRVVGDYIEPQRWLTRVAANGSTERPVSDEFSLELIGQAGLAIAHDDGWKAFDVESGDLRWAAPSGLTLLAARPDGGVAALDESTGELQITDGGGGVESRQPFDLWWAVQDGGNWIGLRNSDLTAVVGSLDDATRFRAKDTKTGQQRVRLPGIGVWLKSHNAQDPIPTFQHISVRVTPFDQDWLINNAARFETCQPSSPCVPLGRDVFGNRFFTIGAGTGGGDTNVQCVGQLIKGFNRPKDVGAAPATPLKELPIDRQFQRIIVDSLLQNFDAFQNTLPYYCFPEERPGFYNSNSFAHGILHAAGVPHDEAPPTRLAAPGWQTPVPPVFFAR